MNNNKHELKDLKVGQKMWSIELGDCEVEMIKNEDNIFAVTCQNKNNFIKTYSKQGFTGLDYAYQSLFYSNPFEETPQVELKSAYEQSITNMKQVEEPELTMDSVLVAKRDLVSNNHDWNLFIKDYTYKICSLTKGKNNDRVEVYGQQGEMATFSKNKTTVDYWGNYFTLKPKEEPNKFFEPKIVNWQGKLPNEIIEDLKEVVQPEEVKGELIDWDKAFRLKKLHNNSILEVVEILTNFGLTGNDAVYCAIKIVEKFNQK